MAASTSQWSATGNKPGNGPKIETKADCYESSDHKPVKGNVCDNDKGNHLQLCNVKQPEHGKVTWDKAGNFCYEPKDNKWCGEDKFCYIVKDKFGQEQEQWCKIIVKEPEKHPIDAKDDSFCLSECETLCFDVLKNDCVDGLKDFKWVVKGLDADAGKLCYLGDGKFSFEAYKDADCYDECIDICYTVKDCYGQTDTATARIKVKDLGGYHDTPLVS